MLYKLSMHRYNAVLVQVQWSESTRDFVLELIEQTNR